MKIKPIAGAALRRVLEPIGYTVVPLRRGGLGYVTHANIAAEATAAGRSIADHVTNLWNDGKRLDALVEHLRSVAPLAHCADILEIGAGTGRFLERIRPLCAAGASYEVYETDAAWARHLVDTYGVTAPACDGLSLAHTPDQSRDLVHAHYVMVYLPATTAFRYFREMARVTRPGGFIAFDTYLDDDVSLAEIEEWLNTADSWQMILPRRAVIEQFEALGCKLVDDAFRMKAYRGKSRYLVFRKGD